MVEVAIFVYTVDVFKENKSLNSLVCSFEKDVNQTTRTLDGDSFHKFYSFALHFNAHVLRTESVNGTGCVMGNAE